MQIVLFQPRPLAFLILGLIFLYCCLVFNAVDIGSPCVVSGWPPISSDSPSSASQVWEGSKSLYILPDFFFILICGSLFYFLAFKDV